MLFRIFSFCTYPFVIFHACGDGIVHVIVFVLAESSPEYNVAVSCGKLFILLVKLVVPVVIERIIRLIAYLPLSRILVSYYGTLALAELEMLVLQDPRERSLGIGVVYYSIALEVISVGKIFRLKSQTSVNF